MSKFPVIEVDASYDALYANDRYGDEFMSPFLWLQARYGSLVEGGPIRRAADGTVLLYLDELELFPGEYALLCMDLAESGLGARVGRKL